LVLLFKKEPLTFTYSGTPNLKREGERTSVFTRRALVVMAAQTGALGLLAAKLYRVQVEEGSRYATLAESNRISARLIASPRGRILDRFGDELAGNTLNWRALLLAEETTDIAATLDRFSSLVPLDDHDRARIERELKHNRRFIPVTVKEFLNWDEMARLEVNAPDLPGVFVDAGTTRHYPHGPDLAHIVGYVAPPSEQDLGDDPVLALPGVRVGRAGVEMFHEDDLRGDAGEVQMEVNSVGRVIRELDRHDGTPGDTLGLTIDAALQKSILDRLGDAAASAVVMDCTNGEVLAMTTTPSFDPSLFDSGVSEKQWVEWTSNRRTPLINKATAGVYPPGSTFKMAVGLAGLRAGTLTMTDRIFCPGYITVGDTRFHCWRKRGHGSLDLHGGLKHSCDVFFYEVARRTGIDPVAAVANEFSLGVDPGVDLPGARKGLMPTKAWRRKHGHAWTIGDTISCGIGQGYIEATPLQLATYCSRIATGRAVVPHVTRTINAELQPGTKPDDYPAMDIPDDALAAVRAGMFAVVNEAGGTAVHARLGIPGMQLAGKTGSSQVRHVSRWAREHGHFNSAALPWEFRPHALFICFAPYDAPRYAVAVVVEHGNAGADVAAPLARDIMRDTILRDPVNRQVAPGQALAQGT
jgi:penicillin-binding protein 2